MAVLTGFEPAASALTGRRALQTAPQDHDAESRPQGSSNPRYRLERAASWATRRWGLGLHWRRSIVAAGRYGSPRAHDGSLACLVVPLALVAGVQRRRAAARRRAGRSRRRRVRSSPTLDQIADRGRARRRLRPGRVRADPRRRGRALRRRPSTDLKKVVPDDARPDLDRGRGRGAAVPVRGRRDRARASLDAYARDDVRPHRDDRDPDRPAPGSSTTAAPARSEMRACTP